MTFKGKLLTLSIETGWVVRPVDSGIVLLGIVAKAHFDFIIDQIL